MKMTLPELVERLGAEKLANDLGMHITTVEKWGRLDNFPRPTTAWKIIKMMNGLMDWESIYQPFADKSETFN